MRVALVHYWLVGMRGGEKVLEALCALFPDADIFTHVCDPRALSPTLRKHSIHTSFVSRLPFASRWYKAYLPFMPMALESFDLSAYDLVISSESGPAKGVITRPDALHICYCHTPMRYIWDLAPFYRRQMHVATRWAFAPLAHYLRLADVTSASRVDAFVANSAFVRSRIRKYYRRDATVIHPPVDTEFFSACAPQPGLHYLVAGQLVEYKRADLAVTACAELGVPLVVVGDGPERSRLERLAGPTVTFTGRVSDDVLRSYMASCKALLFPGVEDFGIVPVEAMACGKPVIAMAAGGALETLLAGQTGLFFREQSVHALKAALIAFEQGEYVFEADQLRAHARAFDKATFMHAMRAFIDSAFQERA